MKAREKRAYTAAHDRFVQEVLAKGSCFFQELWPHECDGPMDPCHILRAQYLRNEGRLQKLDPELLYEFIYDPRNGVPGCRQYHHRFDNYYLRLYQSQLPPAFFEFVKDWEERLEVPGRFMARVDKLFPKDEPHAG